MVEPKRLFLSHASEDKPFVNRLIRRLQEYGLDDAWYDVREISATSDIHEALKSGVQTATYFAIVLSPRSAASQWVSFEIKHASDMDKPVLALIDAAPDEVAPLLRNPFINELLHGGRHRVIQFGMQFDAGFLELLTEIAPDIAKPAVVDARLRLIFDGDDPDAAEREMGFAAIDAAAYLPGLLTKLPALRNSRKLRQRAERLSCHIGDTVIGPLFAALTLQLDIPSETLRAAPDQVAQAIHQGPEKMLSGSSALDALRWMILNPAVAHEWSSQLGAEYCLIAVGKQNARLKTLILNLINGWLSEATSLISELRGADNPFDDAFYDRIRLLIETAGRLAPDGAINSFLVHEYVTKTLWGRHADDAIHKLASYAATFFSQTHDDASLKYLMSLLTSGSPSIRGYIIGNRVPNPLEDCFVPFGSRAVELLLQAADKQPELRRCVMLNLAAMPDPLANRPVLKQLEDNPGMDVAERSNLIGRLARNRVPETAAAVIAAYHQNDRWMTGFDDYWQLSVDIAIAVATSYGSDRAVTELVIDRLLNHEHAHVVLFACKAVGELGLFNFYQRLQDVFQRTNSPQVRAHAGIALARRGAIERAVLLARLQYAEAAHERPLLSIALSYFDDAAAIPGLVRGLQDTFDEQNEEFHEAFASALGRMTLDEAKAARAKWYCRR